MPRIPTPAFPFLAPLLRALRLQSSQTQKQFARIAGLDVRAYQRFEAGTRSPDLGTVKKLCAAIGQGIKPWMLLCDDLRLVAAKTGVSIAQIVPRPRIPGRPTNGESPRVRFILVRQKNDNDDIEVACLAKLGLNGLFAADKIVALPNPDEYAILDLRLDDRMTVISWRRNYAEGIPKFPYLYDVVTEAP